ncbi:class I SAM-dependent methyltransferase family protein [Plantactinospora sp. KLBMP9567]|uniref:class I SAM-dependent methyltransferase family protein n=1 Tax=Plantactinospora sp. KLBMP9567 TaxID=3085900 RepID=UPI0029818239|nr:class I SAM-dependent methyltransferase family protein [Plantactinospora sp. KLBMP9567]MDW5323152.1 class I SAM-dependent methyltransferase family protein [Plantactinospora sp. KLBMP9567]
MAERTTQQNWYDWHDDYADPDSVLSRRLATVQARIGEFLNAAAPGPIRAVSVCAGQGRDLLDVLAGHPRRVDVTARLVELDPRNARIAGDAARAAGLDGVEVVVGDAAPVEGYADLVPADLVLVCGVFGNITDDDVRRTVGYCAQLCATGGTVVWTRHRGEPDLVPRICEWFAAEGFELTWLSAPDAGFGVGTHRFTGTPRPLDRGGRMFTFVGAPLPG